MGRIQQCTNKSKGSTGCGKMQQMVAHPQVKGAPVCQAHALYPAIGAVNLCVPAIFRIVCHLIVQVLPEPEPLWVDAHLYLQAGSLDESASLAC